MRHLYHRQQQTQPGLHFVLLILIIYLQVCATFKSLTLGDVTTTEKRETTQSTKAEEAISAKAATAEATTAHVSNLNTTAEEFLDVFSTSPLTLTFQGCSPTRCACHAFTGNVFPLSINNSISPLVFIMRYRENRTCKCKLCCRVEGVTISIDSFHFQLCCCKLVRSEKQKQCLDIDPAVVGLVWSVTYPVISGILGNRLSRD